MVSCPLFVSCVGRVHLFFSIHSSRDDYEELSKLEHEPIDITPAPVLTRLEGLDNRVVGRVEMLGGVLILRIVTATDMSTDETEAQVHPGITEAGPGCPCVSNQGRNGPSLSGGLGGVGCMTCSLPVTIAIAAMDRRTEAMANPLDPAVWGSDIK